MQVNETEEGAPAGIGTPLTNGSFLSRETLTPRLGRPMFSSIEIKKMGNPKQGING
jgi:hypothetical protein